jgi:uncharacterized protein YcfL
MTQVVRWRLKKIGQTVNLPSIGVCPVARLGQPQERSLCMRFKLIAVAAFALLTSGCATPPPSPPAPGSAASKVVAMGELKNIAIGNMRVARENGFMTVGVQLNNTNKRNKTFYYRFAWLSAEGFPVADDEVWKPQLIYGGQNSFLQSIAPTPKAVDFRLELQTP